ncbi:MAG TPA: hypothetical protein VG819_13835 [Rhizomicrobium sp.]|jgi:hypothetical protein|nr:hypothetical protein [Rhizomicrobium sp.]
MASRRNRAPKSRARAIEIKAKLAGLRKGVTSAELVAAIREKYPEIIRIEKDDFVELGLTSLATSVLNLKPKKSKLRNDLFEGFSVPASVTLRRYGSERRNVTKNLDLLTEMELQQFIDAHSRAPKEPSEMIRLQDYVRPYWQPGWTLKQAFQAAQVAQGGATSNRKS